MGQRQKTGYIPDTFRQNFHGDQGYDNHIPDQYGRPSSRDKPSQRVAQGKEGKRAQTNRCDHTRSMTIKADMIDSFTKQE